MSRRQTTGLRKPSTKLGARVAAKRSAASVFEPLPSPMPASELEASAVDRPTMPEVPEARRSSSGESGPPAAEPSVATESGAHDDELSLSSSFFASEPKHFDPALLDTAHVDSGRFDSLAPISTRHRGRAAELHFDDALEHDLEHDLEAPSPAQLARQSRMRRIAFGIVGAVALTMSTLVAAQSLLGGTGSKHDATGPTGYATDAVLAAPAPVAAAESKPIVPAKAEPAPSEPAKAEPAKTEHAPSEPAKAEPAPSEPAKAEPSAEPPAQLTQKSVRALERGKRDEAIELASRSIEADPTDALPYLIKGSAFLEKGDMKSARAIFDACVTHAKRGATYECAAMGGKKQR